MTTVTSRFIAKSGANQATAVPPPPAADTVGNIQQKTGWKDLNFKVTPDFHHFYKSLAVKHRLSNVEMLRRALDCYIKTYGGLD